MLTILLLLSASCDPYRPRGCDRAELNQVYHRSYSDEQETWIPSLRQWIFWDWSTRHGCFVVREWQMVETNARPMRIGNRWLLPLYDKVRGLRVIAPLSYGPSWTDHDPEVLNRNVLPQGRRRAISGENP
jgi:hypothetical protein